MSRTIPVLAAGICLALSGIVSGVWTNRWGASAELLEAARRCDELGRECPNVGDWKSQPMEPPSKEALRIAQIAGYASIRYVNSSGAEVSVLLICGPPRHVSVHTPEICFPGAGFKEVGDKRKQPIKPPDSPEAEFWVSQFGKELPDSTSVRVYWAWSVGGNWKAAQNPRLAFARSSYLYKLYVVQPLSKVDAPLSDDPGQAFLRVLLPELQKRLAPIS